MINIEKIYYTIADEYKRTNPFETKESDRIYDALYYKYIEPHDNEHQEGFDLLGELISNERRTAFAVGFKAAMQLFFEGLSSAPKETHKVIKEYGESKSTPQAADMPL